MCVAGIELRPSDLAANTFDQLTHLSSPCFGMSRCTNVLRQSKWCDAGDVRTSRGRGIELGLRDKPFCGEVIFSQGVKIM